jgi:HlyD family secretion protein
MNGERRSRRSLWIGLAIAALVAGAAIARSLSGRAPPPLRIETAAVDRGRVAARITASGTLSAIVTVQVGSQVSGRIATLAVDYNTTVKKGQVIATIDPELFRAAVESARANLAAARANRDQSVAQAEDADRQARRAEELAKDAFISAADRDTAGANARVARARVASSEAAVQQAEAALHQAEINLRYTTIVSPIDGVVVSKSVDVGQTVAASLSAPTLFTIAQDLTKMQVDTNVAEADVGKVRPGMPVSFTVDAYPGRRFQGTVRQVRDAAITVQNVVTYDAVIDVDNGERLLKPGMTATVQLVFAEREDVVRIPNAALRFRPDGPTQRLLASLAAPADGARTSTAGAPGPRGSTLGASGPARPGRDAPPDQRTVWRDEDGRPRAIPVRIGVSDGTWTELVEGPLAPGDKLVVEAISTAQVTAPLGGGPPVRR